jgi:hypothetical protein
MVNSGMVNGPKSYFPPPCFCESFAVLGRIPRFQNPVKYVRRFEVNHKTVHPARASAVRRRYFSRFINPLVNANDLKSRRRYNGALKKIAGIAENWPEFPQVRG